MFHKVRINDTIHAYKPNQQWTLCGESKVHAQRVETNVTCVDCVDIAHATAIRNTNKSLGYDYYPELRAVN